MSNKQIEKLAKIIQDNSNCYVQVDNDCWTIYKHELTDEDYDKNYDLKGGVELASSDDYWQIDLYGTGNCYGQAVLVALAHLQGIKVESV